MFDDNMVDIIYSKYQKLTTNMPLGRSIVQWAKNDHHRPQTVDFPFKFDEFLTPEILSDDIQKKYNEVYKHLGLLPQQKINQVQQEYSEKQKTENKIPLHQKIKKGDPMSADELSKDPIFKSLISIGMTNSKSSRVKSTYERTLLREKIVEVSGGKIKDNKVIDKMLDIMPSNMFSIFNLFSKTKHHSKALSKLIDAMATHITNANYLGGKVGFLQLLAMQKMAMKVLLKETKHKKMKKWAEEVSKTLQDELNQIILQIQKTQQELQKSEDDYLKLMKQFFQDIKPEIEQSFEKMLDSFSQTIDTSSSKITDEYNTFAKEQPESAERLKSLGFDLNDKDENTSWLFGSMPDLGKEFKFSDKGNKAQFLDLLTPLVDTIKQDQQQEDWLEQATRMMLSRSSGDEHKTIVMTKELMSSMQGQIMLKNCVDTGLQFNSEIGEAMDKCMGELLQKVTEKYKLDQGEIVPEEFLKTELQNCLKNMQEHNEITAQHFESVSKLGNQMIEKVMVEINSKQLSLSDEKNMSPTEEKTEESSKQLEFI